MEDLDLIVSRIEKEKQYEHQVGLIYNELVSEISETFGYHWIEPQCPDTTKFTMEKEVVGQDKDCEEKKTDTSVSQVNSNQEGDTGASFNTTKHTEKVIWKQKSQEEEKRNKSKQRKKKEDVSAAILKNQEEIMRRLNKIEKEKQDTSNQRKGEKRKVKNDEVKEKRESQTQDTSPMEPVKAMIGAAKKYIKQNTDIKVVQEQVRMKNKEKEMASESENEGKWNIEMEVDEGLRKDLDENHHECEYEDVSEFEAMSDDNLKQAHKTKAYKQSLFPIEEEDHIRVVREVEETERHTNTTKRPRMTAMEATQDLRSLLGVKGSNRICTGNCEDLRPHKWCRVCRKETDKIMEDTYCEAWDFARQVPKEKQDEALEWAVKRGKKPTRGEELQEESKKENYQRKMARFLTQNHPAFKTSEGQEVDNLFNSFMDEQDHVGRGFMKDHYHSINPVFTKLKRNNFRCCRKEEPVGTVRQQANHAVEDHSHVCRSQVKCLACLTIGREAIFCSPARLARHISNVHERLLICGHQRAHMRSKSDPWLQAYSQMISSFTIERLHMQGYLTDNYYINKPDKPRGNLN